MHEEEEEGERVGGREQAERAAARCPASAAGTHLWSGGASAELTEPPGCPSL
jgi:hypothetical protein